MACFLRIYGTVLDADSLALCANFEIESVFRRGEPRNRVSRVLNKISGIQAVVSNAGFEEFDQQLSEALDFLEVHCENIRSMTVLSGVDEAFLDFGTGWLDHAAQFWRFPAAFIKKLTESGLALELSHYPTQE